MSVQTSDAQNSHLALVIAVALAAGVFILDWMTPRGMAPQRCLKDGERRIKRGSI
jgi:hypothetical protein